MSVQKAFDILSETLGDDFKFKDKFNEFQAAMMSSQHALQEFSDFVLGLYPNAKYVYFTAEYDITNRMSRLGIYEIVSEDNQVLDTDDSLRRPNFPVHSKMFDFLQNGIVDDDLHIENDCEEEKFRFELATLEVLEFMDFEDDEDYLAKQGGRI